jgi:ABC-type sulfate transport system permease subunit
MKNAFSILTPPQLKWSMLLTVLLRDINTTGEMKAWDSVVSYSEDRG